MHPSTPSPAISCTTSGGDHYVDAAFHAYGGGIFNACDDDWAPNHCVVLVGWNDGQGVWFLRNSWGTDWGEDRNGVSWDEDGDGIQDHEGGYMRIAYNCSRIGHYATYVQYADTSAGVWVDFAYSGTETGSFWAPYNSLSEGISAVASGGVLSIKAGSAAGTWTLSKPMTIRAGGGTVTIGQ
jgi:hypothetical protein